MSELDDFWSLYAVEGRDSLDVVDEVLIDLDDQRDSKDMIGRLFRSMHTFKGNSRMMGLSNIEKLAHVAEDIIGLVRDHGIALDDEMLDILVDTADMLRDMAEMAISKHSDVPVDMGNDVYARLTAIYTARHAGESSPVAKVVEVTPAPSEAPPIEVVSPVSSVEVDQPSSQEVSVVNSATSEENDEAVLEPESITFDPIDTSSLANDPVYREIFFSLASEIIAELTNSLIRFDEDAEAAKAAFGQELERLIFASEQIGMRQWLVMLVELRDLLTQDPPKEMLQVGLEALMNQYENDNKASSHISDIQMATMSVEHSETIHHFFEQTHAPVVKISSLIESWQKQEISFEDTRQGLTTALERVKQLVAPTGYVRLIDILDQAIETMGRSVDNQEKFFTDFSRYEFQLYEGLAQIQDVEISDTSDLSFNASYHLRNWCAERAFDVLMTLSEFARELQADKSQLANAVPDVKFFLTVLHYGSQYYSLGSASHLCLSLVDLFERVRQGSLPPDVILLHITKSFVDDMEIVLNSVVSGHTPDMAHIENLLNKASTTSFEVQGSVSAASIEARLSLPKSFHKVLTNESVVTATEALDAGENFYIIRADLDHYQDLAERFLAWVHSGVVKVISNVTVMRGDHTIFDFLVATRLEKNALVTALVSLDPDGNALILEASLKDRKHEEVKAQRQQGQSTAAAVTAANVGGRDFDMASMNMSSSMLDAIGELVTSQGIVNHLIEGMAEFDLMGLIDDQMRVAGGDWKKARVSVRLFMETWSEQLEQLRQTNIQMNTMLEGLQEEAMQMRVRPAVTLLKPIESFALDLASMCSKKIALKVTGDKEMLDANLLEQLKVPLRSLVAFMITQSIQMPEKRISEGLSGVATITLNLMKYEDRVELELIDDGVGLELGSIQQRIQQLGWHDIDPLDAVLRHGFGSVVSTYSSDTTGVDLSAVMTELRLQGGSLSLQQANHGGLLANISLPLAMLVQEGMVVRAGKVHYVVPIDAIQRIVRPELDRLMEVSANGNQRMLKLDDASIVSIGQLMKANDVALEIDQSLSRHLSGELSAHDNNHHHHHVQDEDERRIFVIIERNGDRVALEIDELIGQQQVLVRPLLGYLSGIRGVTGCALLGSGDVGMVIDVGYMTTEILKSA